MFIYLVSAYCVPSMCWSLCDSFEYSLVKKTDMDSAFTELPTGPQFPYLYKRDEDNPWIPGLLWGISSDGGCERSLVVCRRRWSLRSHSLMLLLLQESAQHISISSLLPRPPSTSYVVSMTQLKSYLTQNLPAYYEVVFIH